MLENHVVYEAVLPTLAAARCQKFLVACAHMKVSIRASFTIGGEHYALASPGSTSMFFNVRISPSRVEEFQRISGVILKEIGKLHTNSHKT
jgi:hypothetical protein